MPEIVAYKKLAKLPRIILEGDMLGKIKTWYLDNHLSPLVPPIYNRFVIEYIGGARMSVPVSRLGLAAAWGFRESPNTMKYQSIAEFPREYEVLERHIWVALEIPVELLVEYDKSLTVMSVTAYEDGHRAMSSSLDYNDYDAASNVWRVAVEQNDKFTPEEIERNRSALHDQLMSAIAVQNYVLYHRSEEIAEPRTVRVTSNPGRHEPTKKSGGKPSEKIVNIRHQKRKTIVIREGDSLPRRDYNYKTLAWNVRGHYARRGADKHMVYIAPYICRRNGDENKKPKNTIYRITEGEKE